MKKFINILIICCSLNIKSSDDMPKIVPTSGGGPAIPSGTATNVAPQYLFELPCDLENQTNQKIPLYPYLNNIYIHNDTDTDFIICRDKDYAGHIKKGESTLINKMKSIFFYYDFNRCKMAPRYLKLYIATPEINYQTICSSSEKPLLTKIIEPSKNANYMVIGSVAKDKNAIIQVKEDWKETPSIPNVIDKLRNNDPNYKAY